VGYSGDVKLNGFLLSVEIEVTIFRLDVRLFVLFPGISVNPRDISIYKTDVSLFIIPPHTVPPLIYSRGDRLIQEPENKSS